MRSRGITVGNNIFALDLVQAAGLIAQDPWIEKVDVVRKLPSTISIAVVERDAAALVAIGGEPDPATRFGDIFKKLSDRDRSDLPIVTGSRLVRWRTIVHSSFEPLDGYWTWPMSSSGSGLPNAILFKSFTLKRTEPWT